jgi:hypothetical protein
LLENAFGIKLNDAFARIYILDSYSNQVLEDAMYEQTLMKEFEQDPDAVVKLELYHMFEDIMFGLKGNEARMSQRLNELQ